MHIDHVNIKAPLDMLEKVRDFYCQALRLTVGFRPDFSGNGYWLYADDAPIIHLSESHDLCSDELQSCFDHFALQTRGLARMVAKLDELGLDYKLNHVPESNLAQIFLNDPCGTGVEINFVNESL